MERGCHRLNNNFKGLLLLSLWMMLSYFVRAVGWGKPHVMAEVIGRFWSSPPTDNAENSNSGVIKYAKQHV